MNTEEVPLIDIAPFFKGTPAEKQAVVKAVGHACQEIGFLTLTGHGVSPDLIYSVNDVARRFFDLPLAEKMRWQGQTSGMGYLPPEAESLAASLDVKTAHDLKESLNLDLNTEVDPWPEQPPDLKTLCNTYFHTMLNLSAGIMRIFALALDLPEHYFDDKIDNPIATIRLLNYPAVENAPQSDQFRAAAHTDYGTITLLWSEDIRGLQVRNRSGEWLNVENVPGSYVVNIGDMMMRWTNDRWISTLHRVAVPTDPAARGRRRQSVVFFHNPNPKTTVAALESCVSTDNPAKYPPVTAQDFYLMKATKSLGTQKTM